MNEKDKDKIPDQTNSERKSVFKTSSGVKIKSVYTLEDTNDYENQIGLPGSFPFTRGIHKTMYRTKFWTMRQYAGFGTPEETNKRYNMLLSEGQTGLSVAFDLPTQLGYDSDNELSIGEVGKVGVAISSLKDMEKLFEGIDLRKVSVSMTINATAPILLAIYIVTAKKQGINENELSGTIQNDILKEYFARGTYIYPPKESIKLCTDIIEYCTLNMPKFNPISVSGYHAREAGCNAVQELAFTFSSAIEYVTACLERGLNIDDFAKKLSFFFSVDNNFFEEIAKFRAARRIWAKLMKERFKAKDVRSFALRFHSQTAGSTLTVQQTENNIVRVSLQALAAVLGGTQSLHTDSKDETIGLPTENAVLTALRTQQIIAEETGIADTVDPLGGSYYIEKMTDEIERNVREYINLIDSQGGMRKSVETGFIQKKIHESAYEMQKEIEAGEKIIVGVNKYITNDKSDIITMKINSESEEIQRNNVGKLKNSRSEIERKKVFDSLEKIKKDAISQKNLMSSIIEAIENYATVGEISNCLREVFGEYKSAD